ncbi:MAG: carbohydrate-binding domain-containing protein, partial [Armatimonadota bacterium]
MLRLSPLLIAASAALLAVGQGQTAPQSTVLYVAITGQDTWTGHLPAAAGNDGPFATLARARDEVRALKARPQGLGEPVTILVRGGTYLLKEPLVLGPEDTGTAACPISFQAYPGETPVLSGGVPVGGWKKGPGPLWTASVPEAAKIGGKQLFVGGQRQILARYPNFDPDHPTTGGFLFARSPEHWTGGFGACVGSIHNPGDYLEYDTTIPAAGEYHFWVYYGAFNHPFGNDTMDGRTQVTVDGGTPIPLTNLPDTGDWGRFTWADTARLTLSAGKHTLRWTNLKGGGLNLDAFALSDDPSYQPRGTDLKVPAADKHLLVLQCEAFSHARGPSMTVDGYTDPTGTKLYFDRGALHNWPASPDKLLHIFVYEGGLCSNTISPVSAIDEEQSLLTMPHPLAGYRAEVGARFFVDNVREALDSPKEWSLDRPTGTLTYYP